MLFIEKLSIEQLSSEKAPIVVNLTINTLIKGPVDVSEDQLVHFITPLLGFPAKLKRWLIYQTQSGPSYWLQSVEDEKIGFCILAPFQAGLDPEIELSADDVRDIGAKDANDIDVYTMVVLDKDPQQSRTNLRAPLLICRETRLAKQVVLNDARLPIKFFLRDLQNHSLNKARMKTKRR
jgi:flagellar assembly factor FliW